MKSITERATTTSTNRIYDRSVVQAEANRGVVKLSAEKTVRRLRVTLEIAQTTSPILVRAEVAMTAN